MSISSIQHWSFLHSFNLFLHTFLFIFHHFSLIWGTFWEWREIQKTLISWGKRGSHEIPPVFLIHMLFIVFHCCFIVFSSLVRSLFSSTLVSRVPSPPGSAPPNWLLNILSCHGIKEKWYRIYFIYVYIYIYILYYIYIYSI